MKTHRQGTLDGLCGLYALVNAIRRVSPQVDAERLMARLVRNLQRAGCLATAFSGGISRTRLSVLASVAVAHCRLREGIDLELHHPFWCRRPRSRSAFLSELADVSLRDDLAIILGLSGASGGHWTVLNRIEGPKIRFADSSGLVSLPLTDVSVTGTKRKSELCHIEAGCLVAVRRRA